MWVDSCVPLESAHDISLDPVLRALPACPHLDNVIIRTECANAGAMKHLLQLRSDTRLNLSLNTEHWLAVADEIRQGRCHVQSLILWMLEEARFEDTKAVKAVASAIQMDHNLTTLYLRMDNGFTDEAGMALAEALTVNKTLREITLSDTEGDRIVRNKAALGARSYQAFAAMLRVNTNLDLELPPLDVAVRDERIFEAYTQMQIEQRLNEVGRGELLSSSQTTKMEWVDALHELSISNEFNESDAFLLSCRFSLLRLKPEVVSMS
jgi:hypothetical protein